MPEHDLCLLTLDGSSVRLILRRGGMTGGWKSHSLRSGAHVLMSLGYSFVVDNWIHESSLFKLTRTVFKSSTAVTPCLRALHIVYVPAVRRRERSSWISKVRRQYRTH